MDNQVFTLAEWHKKQAVESFNNTWDIIDKKERTSDDNLLMIHQAHASRFHWDMIGSPLEWARGEWQLSRVYALVAMGESSKYHAEHSLKYCIDNGIGDFDLAFAYEALARAYSVQGKTDLSNHYIQLARTAAETIVKDEDRNYLLSELVTIL